MIKKIKQNQSDLRVELLNQIVAGWVRELKFHPVRRWRFDYAHEPLKIAVEVEGGVWTGNSRHTRGKGYIADCEKYNQAQILGYNVMRYAPNQLAEMVEDIRSLCWQRWTRAQSE